MFGNKAVTCESFLAMTLMHNTTHSKTLTLIAVMFLAALSDKSCSTDANKQETAPKKVGLGGKNVKPWQGPNGGNNNGVKPNGGNNNGVKPNGGNNNGVKPNGGNEGTKTLAKKVEACVKSIRNESHEFTVEQLLTELETLIKDNSAEGKHPFSTMKFEDDYNHTLLRLAARYGKIHIVKSLIDAGAEVNAVDDDGNTPLHLAVKHGKGDTVKALLGAKDIHVNEKDKDDRTPLHLAIIDKNKEVVEALLGAKDIHVNEKDKDDRTPLHLAAWKTDKEVVEALLEVKGINVNAVDNKGYTPLHLSTLNSDSETTVKTLLAKNAKVDEKNKYGQTPLHMAFFHNNKNGAQALLDNDANVNAVDDDGNTPLHLAVKYSKGDTVKALLGAKDIHVNAVDKDDRTPLHVAVKYSKGDTVQALIAEGANVNAVDNKGWTPLHRLAHFGGSCIDTPFEKRNNRRQYQKEIVLSIAKSLLEVKGINVNAADKDGKTPLALATERRDSKKAEEWEKEEAEAIIALLEQYSKT